MLIGVIFFNVLAWRILVKVSIGLLSVSINGFKNRDKKDEVLFKYFSRWLLRF